MLVSMLHVCCRADIFRGLKKSVVSSRISFDDHLSETNYTSNALLRLYLRCTQFQHDHTHMKCSVFKGE